LLPQNKFLFLTLKVFSATGGIEKVCRVMGKALYEYGLQADMCIEIMSMHDHQNQADRNVYFPKHIFTGFAAHKGSFVVNAVKKGRRADVVVISHINLLVVGWLIKKVNPSAKIMLLAHGIEIWGNLNFYKKKMLSACDKILCVSQFTADKVLANNKLPNTEVNVLNNCIDPFLPLPDSAYPGQKLREKYKIESDDVVLMTLTRLSYADRYKGYDVVLNAMVDIVKTNKKIKYLLAGGSSKDEKVFIDHLVQKYGIEENVILAGYIPEEELIAYFSMADMYVMPSTKEGFGIVFIEAMYYGLPVIAGNKDGSTDALLNGQLGLLIEPNSPAAIKDAIEKMMLAKKAFKPNHKLLMHHFGYDTYKRNIEKIIAGA
jgi:phosphatidylinositol alpha-1,6-mannosyltransferase